jgi:NAD(P)-dependent dehydrogenase (short-subunit alcohol dehydrogenase family)
VAKLDAVTKEISGAGGAAETAQVDALDEQSVEKHAAKVAQKAGHIDISFNVISIPNFQGTPLVKLSVDDFALPVMNFVKTHFLTARAAARHMVKKKSGVILMMTTTPDRRAILLVGAFGVACAAIEAFSHTLAAETGPHGVRVVCLRSSGSPEAVGVQKSFAKHAKAAGMTLEEWQANTRAVCRKELSMKPA